MAMNITEVRLCAVPLENDYKHTIYFDSKSEQLSYFHGKVVHSASNLSYQRRENVIRFPKHFDDLQNCNYVMYKNTAYTDKWFYGFITDMEYVNDERTDITFEIDVLQTYLNEYTVQPSFVEREHCTSDGVGEHTLAENLEIGEYVCNDVVTDTDLKDYCYLVNTTEYVGKDYSDPERDKPLSINMGGVPLAGGIYVCATEFEVVNVIQALSAVADSVISVYMIPKRIITHSGDIAIFQGQTTPTIYPFNINKPTTLNGYTPRNKKLLTFPFNYLLNSNNAGSSNVLQYEHFSTPTCVFQIAGVPVVGGSIKCSPKDYKGAVVNEEEGIMCGKFPVLSWSADMYTNWLTQNSLNLTLGVVSGGLQVAGGVALMATGGGALAGASSVATGSLTIAQTLGQKYQMSFTPNSARGNTNGGDLNASNKTNTFYFYKMSIKKEVARVIDGYFDMFGYKCNLVKAPAKAHRKAYWYTKTIDVSIDGNIPMKYMQKIKDAYNNGLTFWRENVTMGNYSQDNGIV